jgi:hypothetical protein
MERTEQIAAVLREWLALEIAESEMLDHPEDARHRQALGNLLAQLEPQAAPQRCVVGSYDIDGEPRCIVCGTCWRKDLIEPPECKGG